MPPHPDLVGGLAGSPSHAPRLVASDLDGTLLRPDGSVSTRTREAVRALAGVGVEFVIVTARPPRWLDGLREVAGTHGVAVCGNGAFVYDLDARSVVQTRGFHPRMVRELVAELRAHVPGVVFAAERATGAWVEPAFRDADPRGHAVRRGPIEQLDDEPVGKLLAKAPHLPAERFLRVVQTVVADRAVLGYSGAIGLAELTPPGVTKAAGLADWAAGRGVVAEQVWAFGDMPNDLPMLRWAGRSFAVENAHPDVLAVAAHRIRSNADDGVALVLEWLVTTIGDTPGSGS